MKYKWLAASLAAMMAVGVQAEESASPKGYLGVNLSRIHVDVDEEGIPNDFKYGHLSFRIGGRLNDYIAVEGRGGFGLTDDSSSLGGAELTVETKRSIGAYVLAGIPNPTPIYPYIILGYTGIKSEVSVSVDGDEVFNDAGNDDDVSYGLGANIAINDKSDVSLEYLTLFKDSETEVSAATLGLMYRF
ncbi:porin family protein [Marinobacter sp. SS21]|uniref:porin family protein n=1 Tax=Marinobacter sp. SS21 TaxID=2979460 RepID=UPI00232CB5B2|nr:porin family protein [Marinobacter sp. SS21]